MYIARVLYPVRVLGPGDRVGIWFAGCSKMCTGCSNPELWAIKDEYRISVDKLMELIAIISEEGVIDGFTITGGDPVEQAEELAVLLSRIEKYSDDIILYTGYDYEDVYEKHHNLLEIIAVLIDGKYVESNNSGEALRGSSNQRIIVTNPKYYEKYRDYLSDGVNEIQNFRANSGSVSVGIHKPGFKEELDSILTKKGLKKNE